MIRLRWLTSPSTLRARIFWSLVPIFLVLFGLVGIVNVREHLALAEEQFKKRGYEIATNLAYVGELGVLADDAELLEPSIRSVSRDPDVAFVFIYDASGRLVAKGGNTSEADPLSETSRARFGAERQAFSSGDAVRERIIEFYAPIFSEAVGTPDALLLGLGQDARSAETARSALGWVRVGLSLAPIRRQAAAV